jgi:hypothetical protein
MRTVVPAQRHDPPRDLRPATRKVPPPTWWAVTEMPRRRIGIARTQRDVPGHRRTEIALGALCRYAGALVRLSACAPVPLCAGKPVPLCA